MGSEQIGIILAGALAGGVVNGLTGFGTGITAIGIWLFVLPPTVAGSLAVIASIVSQLQTLPMIWCAIRWERVLPLLIPGVLGVPIGTYLLPHVDPTSFKIGIGSFLILYPTYVFLRKVRTESAWGGRVADGVVGFASGVLGGLAGLPGVLPAVWTDIRGGTKDVRRGVIQAFNMAILSLALVSHAFSGLLTRQVALATAIAFPATAAGAWAGAFVYRRLGDHGYQRAVMILLFVSGVALIWTSV